MFYQRNLVQFLSFPLKGLPELAHCKLKTRQNPALSVLMKWIHMLILVLPVKIGLY